MDGFNIIPEEAKDKELPRLNSDIKSQHFDINSQSLSSSVKKEKDIQIRSFNIFFTVSLLLFIGCISFSVFSFAERYFILNKISSVSAELSQLESTVDRNRIEELKTLDQKFKIIKQRLGKHVISTDVLSLINQNIRSTVQVSEYKFDIGENDVIVNFTSIAPSFKDMAEQTERLFELKNNGGIKSFSVSGLSFEEDTKRIRFNTKINLDRIKFSAGVSNSGGKNI